MVAFAFSVVVLALVAGAGLFGLLANGTIAVDLSKQIAETLNAHVGGRYAFAVGSTALQQTSVGPGLAINGFSVRDGQGRTIVSAPRATLTVDLLGLPFGRVSPKRLELHDLTLRLVRLTDGTMALSGGSETGGDIRLSDLGATLADAQAAPPDPALPGSVPTVAPSLGAAPPPAPPDLPRLVARAVTVATEALFADNSVLRAVDRFGIANATLIVDDRLNGQTLTYHNVAIGLDRDAQGLITMTAEADGPAGHWLLGGNVARLANGARRVNVTASKLSPDELMLAAGVRAAAFETDMPLSFTLGAEVDASGKLTRFGGPLSFGSGYFRLDDPDHEPAMVDRFDATLAMDPRSGALAIDKGMLVADHTRFAYSLAIAPPTTDADPWRASGKASGVFGAERPGEGPIALDKIGFDARVYPAARHVVFDQAFVNGPDVSFRMSADFAPTPTGFLVKSGMEIGRTPGSVLIRLWPNWVASPIRAWFLRNLQGGTLDYGRAQMALTDTDLELMKHQHSPPDDHSRIEFGVSNASLSFMAGVPPLRGLDGVGVITGDTFTLKATKAEMDVSPGHKLLASEGTFTVPSTDPKPTPATIAMRVTGTIDTLADLLARDALKSYANLPIDANAIAGNFDGRLTINLKLGTHTPQDDTKIGVVATAKDVTVAKVVGKEPLQGATLAITADAAGGLHAKGDGRMFGAPASLELRKPSGGGPSEATLSLALDDDARRKAGMGFERSIIGPIAAKITTTLSVPDKKANVVLDFTHCAFDSPLPGLKKAAERPSKATFTVTQDPSRSLLDNIVFQSGSTEIRGSAVLDGNGAFTSAALTQMRLSPGDDAKVDVSRAGDGYKVVVRGSNVDARPFLRFATSPDGGDADGPAKDLDLDLHAGIVTGQNGQVLAGADIRLLKRGAQLRKLQLAGRLGHGTVTATSSGTPGQVVVVVAAKDAGAALSFMDLYKRMDGGTLDATLRFANDNRIDGSAVVHRFTLREDPALRKLAEEDVPGGSRNAGSRIDPSDVHFTKLEALFNKTGSVVTVTQGSMYGPQLGATVAGTIDFTHDKVALDGTFVPLYGINNLFSQIPVVGVLLGGDRHEGLFALNYRIAGSASAPVLSFNPLSALAPGFLRKIFGAIDNAAQQGLQNDQARDAGAGTPRDNPFPE